MKSILVQAPWGWILLGLLILVTILQLGYHWYFFRRLAFYRKRDKEQNQTHPVSVIVCARDEADNLARNLPGVLLQQYGTTHEVVVVNHNSQDDTRYLLDEFRKSYKHLKPVNLEQEALGIPGKKYPLSIGIKEAKHELLLLTDADCVPASEHWIQLMQDGYRPGIELVLGYGAYHKRPGLLNKLIRFDTFLTALQYLSYALAGKPYMGVGRNLSYKKDVFLRSKGFSSLNHLVGGDDDLFVNKVATKDNTAVVIDPEAFTLSQPKRSFADWWQQKTRHYSTAGSYKSGHQALLAIYSATQFLFYPLLIACCWWPVWPWALGLYGVRLVSQGLIYYKTMEKLDERDLWPWWWLLDIWMFFFYCIFAPALWKKPARTWNV